MDTLWQDLRFGARSLARHRTFSTVAILTLGLGIGATTAIFSVVSGVLLDPLPYDEPARIVSIWQTDVDDTDEELGGTIAHPDFKDWQQRTRSFEAMALYSDAPLSLSGLGDAEIVQGAVVTPEFFDVFGAQPVPGRTFTPEEDLPGGPRAVVVSHGFWQERLGGTPDVLSRTLRIGGREWQIVGVAPPGFAYPSDARLYLPVRNDDEGCGRGCVYLSGVARLRPGVSPDAARQELKSVSAQLEREYPESNTGTTAELATLHEETVQGVQRALVVLLGAVAMVLLIACANVANLLLVRGAGRSGEVAVRAVLGASRGRLIRQLLTESLLLAAAGGALGLLVAGWGIDGLRALAPEDLPRLDEIGLDASTMLFASGLVVATALLFGLIPALRVARVSLASTIREGGRGEVGGPRRDVGRRAILVAEVALSVLLLVGAGLMIRSFIRLQHVDPAFSRDEAALFTARPAAARYDSPESQLLFHDELRQRLERATGSAVTRISPLPLGPNVFVSSFERTDQPPPEPGSAPYALLRIADVDYFEFMDIVVLRGRDFEPADRLGARRVVVITQALADRYFPDTDPIGRSIEVGVSLGVPEDQPRTIVGIIENVRSTSLTEEPVPEMYIPIAQSVPGSLTYLIRTAQPGSALQAARAELRAMDPELPLIRPGSLSDVLGEHVSRPTFYLLLLGLFATLAVLLAAVGIYGVVAYLVVQRTREIGVRMALGAQAREVIELVVGQGLKPAIVGIVIGVLGAVAGGRIIASMLYETTPQDPLTFAGVVVFLALVVVGACALPAWRATRIPPGIALRAE